MQSRAAPSYFQSYHNSEEVSIEASLSNHTNSSASASPVGSSTSTINNVNGSVQTDVDSNSLSESSQQHSPSTSTTVAATTTAPQRARDRLAKFTATLMGAAGNITGGGHGSLGASIEESESGLSIRDLEDQFMGLKIREADTMAELKEMRQKVMEMETQVNFLMLFLK